MSDTAGTTRLTDKQADETLNLFGVRYRHVASGENGYQFLGYFGGRPRTRKFGRGRMAASVKTRGKR